eukprot:TRINITY_DN20249_c0_g1_i1.p1 TRINITY_DN20249_c0_g1~~TRINITY_DN20249_c0_g1_i1.p1  ORF type:complete len:236 (-),score=52.16 TRINITY_DN20249_c0_g1_i1:827-1534(-)
MMALDKRDGTGEEFADEVNLILSAKLRAAEERYRQAVADAEEEDFSDLEELEFWQEQGVDLDGLQIIRIVGKFLPVKAVDLERLRRFVYRKMHDLIAADEDCCLLYIHTGSAGEENSPGLFWLRSVYESLPAICKQRIKAVYNLHPAIGMRLYLWAIGGWLTFGLYEKMTFVSRVEFLWDYMKKSQVELPDFVIEHDKELETRPLMDYGVEVDPVTVEQNLPHQGGPLGHRMPLF